MRFALSLRTPQRTFSAMALSSAMIALSFLAMDVRVRGLTKDESLPPTWKLFILIAIIGFACRTLFLRGLRVGVQSNLWSEQQLSAARHLAESAAWTALLWVFLICAFLLFLLPTRGHYFGIFGIVPVLSPQEARSILLPTVQSRPGANSIYPAQPLQSSHWGAPPNSEF